MVILARMCNAINSHRMSGQHVTLFTVQGWLVILSQRGASMLITWAFLGEVCFGLEAYRAQAQYSYVHAKITGHRQVLFPSFA